MSNEDLKTREGIKKRLLDLAALANGIKDYQLGALILTAYNRCDDNVTIQNGNLYVNGKLMIIDNATLANYMALSFTADTKSAYSGGKAMKQLIVFTNNGQTYMFDNVSDFKPTTKGFSFEYTGNATGVKRTAVFNSTSACGYALADVAEKAASTKHELDKRSRGAQRRKGFL
ncbi:hypothetical protein FAM18124_02091 [Lacticaseibacillus paracasei]|uniref:hypothetical protein n=1 Tax=Lacticaseibacillus paracasei TaxID=1597 RepID=UPI000F43A2F2|nr:hypothetical protein [Lacticaseibacillus paracasei]MBM6410763.1 hypothetical protein [Lacticaseibacillus paracasei]RND62114.1 hypothetical protein FAM18124_02091 [Lacticaseibacillus paracasei]RND68722.1 hypothetical protein FAM18129_02172 [Lacticaseibacillus paracasei]RNE07297.1 hypothetical protein FAM22279_01982 [Lacticaseibacillus paracasei]